MKPIKTTNAYQSSSPLSQAIQTNDFLFVSGQVPVDPKSGDVRGDTVGEQTDVTFENIAAVLEAAGGSLGDIVKTTVFLTNIEDFQGMNEAYEATFTEPYPARSAFEVADLASDIRVEIEAIAEL